MAPIPIPKRLPIRAGLLGLALLAVGCSSKTPEADTAEVDLGAAGAKPAPAPTPPAAEGATSAPAAPAEAKP